MSQTHEMKEPRQYVNDVNGAHQSFENSANQNEGIVKIRDQANDFLNKSVPANIQKHTFGVQPSPVHTHNSSWVTGLFECFSPPELCLTAWCCPCFLFGRTQARMAGERNPPLFGVNFPCAVFCGLHCCGGFSWAYHTLQRMNMRERLGITGNPIEDCLMSCCCACCSLAQEEKESLLKQAALDEKTTQYSAPTGMSYR